MRCRLFNVHCCATEASLFVFLDLPNICLHISCGEHTFCNTASASAHSWFILVSPSWWGTDGWGLGAEECCPASDGCGSYAARLPQTALKRLLGKGPTWLSWSSKTLETYKRLEVNQLSVSNGRAQVTEKLLLKFPLPERSFKIEKTLQCGYATLIWTLACSLCCSKTFPTVPIFTLSG